MANYNEFLVIVEYEGTTANKRQLFGVRGFGSEYGLFWRDINSNFLPTYEEDDFPWTYIAFSENEEQLFRQKYKQYISFQQKDDDDPPYDCVLDKEVVTISEEAKELNKIMFEEIQKEINAEVIRTIVENSKMYNLQERVDKAHEDGIMAYRDGKSSEDNPYNGVNEDQEFDAWKEGYYNAQWDD